jgi:Fe-S cluster assembly protein SufD
LPTENDLPSTHTETFPLIGDSHKIVVLNGFYQKQMSSLPDTVKIRTILETFEGESSPILSNLNSEVNPFRALNTAFISSGLVVDIPDGTVLEKPIHLLFQTTEISDLLMTHPRFVVKVGVNAEGTLIEHYVGKSHTEYFHNIVTDFSLAENAHLNHIRIQEDGSNATHVASTSYTLESHSSLHGMHFASGSKLYRQNISVILNGEGSEVILNGLCLSNETQHLDHFITIDHDQPQCVSRQLFKYILSDASSGAFNGRIVVKPDSQKTDAIQTNKNLLLSDASLMNSNPQLEIYADDVKCAHGSTSGQMDSEAIFYLQSRGLKKDKARLLLINGFAGEVLQKIRNQSARDYLESHISEWLEDQDFAA